MPRSDDDFRRILKRESVTLLALLLLGLLVLPVAAYFVGGRVFGAYEGDGLSGFLGGLMGRLAGGSGWAWFLVLSPLLIVLVVRSVAWGWHALAANTR
jgi:hypothetical protein